MAYYMHIHSGDVATEQEWRDDFESMDRETWFGVEIDKCQDWHWLCDADHLVEVVKDDNGDWIDA